MPSSPAHIDPAPCPRPGHAKTESVALHGSLQSPESGPDSASDSDLLPKRAESVGWLFLTSYYEFYNSKIDSIFKMYHPSATVTHADFPSVTSPSEPKSVHVAHGVDAIKSRFSTDKSLKSALKAHNRIMVTNASFTVSLAKNILIVVSGEWSRGGSPYYQFFQTFYLVPGRYQSTFDVANDVLNFVDYSEVDTSVPVKDTCASKHESFKLSESAKPVRENGGAKPKAPEAEPVLNSSPKAVTESEPMAESKKEAAAEPVQESVPEPKAEPTAKKPQELAPEITKEVVPELKKKEAVVEKKEPVAEPKIDNASEHAARRPSPEPVDKKKPVVAPSKAAPLANEAKDVAAAAEKADTQPASLASRSELTPSQPMTWAALASQAGADESAIKPIPTPGIVKAPVQSVKKPAQSQISGPTSYGQKGKRDEWYPIYIRGVKGFDEDSLRDHLSKKFGEVQFLQILVNIAYCDFSTREAQRKAIDAEELSMNGLTFTLEPRESRTGNNFHSNAGRKTKEKPVIPESKRVRSDKKMPILKKPSRSKTAA